MKSLIMVAALWLALVLSCSTPARPKSLTSQHRQAINAGLKAKNLPTPESLEITGEFLVATFELSDMPASAKQFAEDSVVTIREAVVNDRLVSAYRVTVNGPSPGTRLIRRYGSARLIEGDQVRWEPVN